MIAHPVDATTLGEDIREGAYLCLDPVCRWRGYPWLRFVTIEGQEGQWVIKTCRRCDGSELERRTR